MRRIVPLVSCVFLTLTVAGCTSGSDTGSSEAPSRIIALTRAGNVAALLLRAATPLLRVELAHVYSNPKSALFQAISLALIAGTISDVSGTTDSTDTAREPR